ncbi:MAG: hypothetical protein VB093_11470, partial [Propionicimonas sp.]|nr:hypothetical protein [Propionicimonas sp.]
GQPATGRPVVPELPVTRPTVPAQSSIRRPVVPELPVTRPTVPEQSTPRPAVPEQSTTRPAVPEPPATRPAVPEQPAPAAGPWTGSRPAPPGGVTYDFGKILQRAAEEALDGRTEPPRGWQ